VIAAPPADGPFVLVSFYRSYLTAADTSPVDVLIRELRAAGFAACGVFAPSLKAAGFADWLRPWLDQAPPVAIVNATAFSARAEDGTTPFDMADCPVFQVALSTARRQDWALSDRGLSPADLAMHVVLPEVDGRMFAGLVSFKSPGKRDPDLQFSRFAHRADAAFGEMEGRVPDQRAIGKHPDIVCRRRGENGTARRRAFFLRRRLDKAEAGVLLDSVEMAAVTQRFAV